MIKPLELIVTKHASDRLNDMWRFPSPPSLPLDEEVRLFKYRRTDTKEIVWMCQIDGGFLVGEMRHTKRRQMLSGYDRHKPGYGSETPLCTPRMPQGRGRQDNIPGSRASMNRELIPALQISDTFSAIAALRISSSTVARGRPSRMASSR